MKQSLFGQKIWIYPNFCLFLHSEKGKKCKYEFRDIDDDDKYFLIVNNKEDYDKLLKIKI